MAFYVLTTADDYNYNGDVYSPMKADNTVTRNRKNRRQTDLLQLLLRKDNPTAIITNSSKHSTR